MTKYLPNDYILLISLGFGLVLFSLNEADTDLFGHLMYGENILQSGSLPALNSYSYTNPDYPWVNHKWLSSLIFASIYRFSGGSGILIFKISIFLLIISLLNSLIKNMHPTVHPVVRYLSLMISAGFLQGGSYPRAHIFTYLFTTLLIWLLYSKLNQKKFGIALFTIFLFWVNLHGGVIAGFGIFYLWILITLLQKTRKPGYSILFWVLTGFLLPIVLIINPYGINLPIQLFTEMLTDKSVIVEWQPLPIFTWDYLIFKILFLALIPISFFWRREIGIFPTVLILITAYLSFRYLRHVPFFGIAAALAFPLPISEYLTKFGSIIYEISDKISNRFMKLHYMLKLFSFSVFLLIMLGPYILKYPDSVNIVLPRGFYPEEHMKWLKENNIKANILNSFNWGKYLTYNLYPNIKVCIDGRFDTAYPETFIIEYFNFFQGNDTSLVFLDKYNHDLILMEANSEITHSLLSHEDWVLLNATEHAALFAKRTWLSKRVVTD